MHAVNDDGTGAAEMVTPSRLHVVLEPAALLRVLDRLCVLGLLPDSLSFDRQQEGDAVLEMAWDDIDTAKAMNLRDRLAQFPSVSAVRFVEPGSPQAVHRMRALGPHA